MAKSITASTMFSWAASLTPTMLIATSSDDHDAPTMMSHGFCFSGAQKIDR